MPSLRIIGMDKWATLTVLFFSILFVQYRYSKSQFKKDDDSVIL